MISDYKELIESNSDLVWEIDTQGVYTYVNDVIESLLGYTADEVIGKTPFDFMTEKEQVKIKDIFEQLESQYKNDWLLPLELLELAIDKEYSIKSKIKEYLEFNQRVIYSGKSDFHPTAI